MHHSQHVVIVGLGNIGQALLPLLRDHFAGCRIVAFDQQADARRRAIAREMNAGFFHCRIDESNHATVLGPHLAPGVFLLNLAPAVSSAALLTLAQAHGAFYLDTGIEPWAYTLQGETTAATSNHALRETVLALERSQRAAGAATPTALVAHGANPGFVSILVKRALLELARVLDTRDTHEIPRNREQWADLAHALDVRVIQISECDTQRARKPRQADEFVNTWSVEGFVTECLQPVELGWGSHEGALPAHAHRPGGPARAAAQLAQRGHELAVRTWTPLQGEIAACVLTHNESLSIADYLTTRAGTRPTVYYAYRPCEDAIGSLALLDGTHDANGSGGAWRERVLKDEIVDGVDELGVLVMSGRGQSIWLGSALSIGRARELAPYNNATSLQVVSSLVAGMQWMHAHPAEGIVESERLEPNGTFACASPYWAPIQCAATAWRPGGSAGELTFDSFLLPGLTLASAPERACATAP